MTFGQRDIDGAVAWDPTRELELVPGTVVGEYVVESFVARGGMGSVYAAVHPVLGKRAAIKVMSHELSQDPTFQRRFVREARAINEIGHPNIVESFSIGKLPDGRSYYVMEWLNGTSLGEQMRRGPLAHQDIVHILREVALGLAAVHAKGIIHRDLKPDNIFLISRSDRLQIKILDFGVAKMSTPTDGLQTSVGTMVGTPAYASPEQLCGEDVDGKTDLYALGVIAFRMLTAKLPYANSRLSEMVAMKVTARAPRVSSMVSDVDPVLEQLIAGLLECSRDNRPDLQIVISTLEQLSLTSGSYPSVTPPSAPGYSTIPTPQSYRTPASGPSGSRPRQQWVFDNPAQKFTPAPAPTPYAQVDEPEPRRRFLLSVTVAAVVAGALATALFAMRDSADPEESAAVEIESVSQEAPSTEPDTTQKRVVPLPRLEPLETPPVTRVETETPAAPEPEVGAIDVQVNVDHARIELDGEVIAKSAGEAKVAQREEGTYELVVSARGRRTVRKKVSVEAGRTAQVDIVLRRKKRARNEEQPGDYLLEPR